MTELGKRVRRWKAKRDWAEWDLEHPYIPVASVSSTGTQSGHDELHADELVGHLAAGEHVTVQPDALPLIVGACATSPNPINLENLSVAGAVNSNLFDHNALDLPRVQMPVISDTADAQNFAQQLAGQGIAASWESVDPRTLEATQNELDGVKVAGMVGAMESHGGVLGSPPPPVLVVDKDGAILDGHHRWAAAATYSVSHPGYQVPIVRMDTTIDKLVPMANAYDDSIPGHEKAKAFGQASAWLVNEWRALKAGTAWATPPKDAPVVPDPSKPYFWIDGKGWVLMATDTQDGVPRSLSVPKVKVHRSAEGDIEQRWKGGYPQGMVDWYNDGADGAINWGEDGDFDDCVAIAGKYIDNPEGFCNLRHQDATGAPPGKAPGEGETKSLRSTTINGKPTRYAAVAKRYTAPMIGAYQAKSAAQIAAVLSGLYAASYAAGLQSAASADTAAGAAITAGISADDSLAPLLDASDADLDALTVDTAPGGLADLLGNVNDIAGNILDYMSQDGAPSDVAQATQMADSEAANGAEVGAQDAAQAGGFSQMQSVPDDTACEICLDKADDPYAIGDDGPPWHPRCGCESEPAGDNGDSSSSDDQESTSALGRNVRRWHKRDWAQWDLEHPYVPTNHDNMASPTNKAITADEARGNSRPVSQDEFNQLAATGDAKLAAIQADSRPTTALNDPAQFQAVKDSAFAEVQKPWGGQTIDPQTGAVQDFKDGYSLTIKPTGTQSVSVPEGASKDEFDKAMDTAVTKFSDQLQGAQTSLGVFHDDDLNRIDIDPVVHVASTSDVESIGAATHAIGGAYEHATGDGYFPPHVEGS